jgi:enoyl-CoA hydratase/carnithine racemase
MIREESIVVSASAIARVVMLARPEKKNAISSELAEALGDAVERAAADPTVRAVILAAEGDVFAAGGDLDEIAAGARAAGGAERVLAIGERLRVIEEAPVPVLTALTGDVYGGGCELVLLTDVIVAEEHARLSFRHARMGLAPAWGGTSRLVERVGSAVAARMLFTGEMIDAGTALDAGLVSELVATGGALQRCLTLAIELSKSSRDGVAGVKQSLVASLKGSRDAARAGEAAVFRRLFGGEAHLAAMKAAGRR